MRKTDLKFSEAAAYRVVIQGILNKDWEERLSGLTITKIDEENNITTLEGELKDQAALAGVLNTFYEYHFPIISVDLSKN